MHPSYTQHSISYNGRNDAASFWLIDNHDGHMGEYWDRIFLLKDGIFKEIFNHADRNRLVTRLRGKR